MNAMAFPDPPPPPHGEVPVQHFGLVDSTSLHARRFVNSGAASAPILFVAEEQTGGVGRFARPWASPRGGLWCTLLWPLPRDRAQREAALDGLGLRIGVACLEAVRAALPLDRTGLPTLDVRLKWPNDILINNHKVLGVLCEIVPTPPPHPPKIFALVGVGLNANLNVDDLPPPLRPAATTLRALTGRETDLGAVAADLTRRLTAALTARGLDGPTLAIARSSLARIGEQVRVTLPDRTVLAGTLTGLSDDGRPVLSTQTGEVRVPSGADVV